MEPEKLRPFKEYAESVLRGLESVHQHPSLQENWVPASLPDCIERLQNAAKEISGRASSPVKIGVMGEFSSGKTLLLGSLIGYADALPVSENPTTGNVTAIHLVQQEGFETTQVNTFTVEYLSREGIQECLNFMLEETQRRATSAGLPSAQMEALKRLNLKDTAVWDSILNFCQVAWNSSKNLELRYLLRELVLFVRTYVAYGAALCGKQYQIDGTTAREGLKLADPAMEIQNLSFDSLPTAPVSLTKPPQSLPARLLQLSFPLIRRVDVEARLSKEIWDLSALKGENEFVLLDFPGLGAANSGVRDMFLSLRELTQVQTILIVLNGKSPGSDRANRIFTMMEQRKQGQDLKDRILVAVGRFDQLPLDSEGGEKVLDELIDDTGSDPLVGEVLSEEDILSQLSVLRTTIATAQAFTTHKDRIVLLSPLLGLADLAKRSSSVKAGSQGFLANLEYPGFLDNSKRLRHKWGQLSKTLLDSDPRSMLGRQLDDFAQDGGIGNLRRLIQSHVTTHGLQQLYDDTCEAARELRQEQDNLKNQLELIKQQGIPIPDSQNFATLRQTIDRLLTTYRNFQKELGEEKLRDRRKVPVSDAVYHELTFRLFNWGEWNRLFQAVNDGIVRLPESNDPLGLADPELDLLDDSGIPKESDDFYDDFAQTVRGMEDFARDRLRNAIIDLLNELSAKVAFGRNDLANIVPSEKEKERIEQIRKKYGNARPLQILLTTATNPNRLQAYFLEQCKLKESTSSTLNPEILFPLARKDEHHKTGQMFDWGRDNQTDPRPFNHQILVLRLRDEMIASAGQALVQYVSETQQQFKKKLGELLNQLINELQNLIKDEALLRDIVAENVEFNSSIPSWLQTLSDIASIQLET